MLDIHRIVEITDRGIGTGYLVSRSLILTAWHVVDPGEDLPPDHGQVSIRILGRYLRSGGKDTRTQKATVIWPLTRPERNFDFALLKTDEPTEAVQTASYLELDGSDPVDVKAIGFPDFKAAVDSEGSEQDRDTHIAAGKLYVGIKQAVSTGSFDVVLNSNELRTKSHQRWGGMSGASIFAGHHLVGIVQDAGQAVNTQILRGLSVHHLFRNRAVQEAVVAAGFEVPRAARAAPRSEDVADFLHLLDRTQISQEFELELNGFFDKPTRPLFLAICARSDDDIDSLYRRIRERDLEQYGGEGITFHTKNIVWPDKPSNVERGRLLLEQELKKQLAFSREQARGLLDPKAVAERIPGSGLLFVYSTIPTTSLSATQVELVKWWESLWTEVAALGGRVVVLLTFEEHVRPAACCTSLAQQCQGLGPRGENVLPEGIGPSWQLLPRPEPIEFDDVDAWIRSDEDETSAWRKLEGGARADAANAFAKTPRLPRGLRCVRLCLPDLMKEIDDD